MPKLYVSRAISALRKAAALPEDRLTALKHAGELFATGTVAGPTATEYATAVCRMSGTPLTNVRTAIHSIRACAAEAYRSAQAARPVGAVNDWRDPPARTGRAVWTRRGDVLALHAPGNHPAVHTTWLEALALGERPGLADGEPCTFDPPSPWTTFWVIDPDTRERVAYGRRGQVVMNHVSKGFLLPNNLERDTAIRSQPPPDGTTATDSVSTVKPLETVGDKRVIEGVYQLLLQGHVARRLPPSPRW
ncbi:hypothetical protein [Streptomyces sp. XD-27]|uniref:hypothetical protein n=1 Tax=Streptomyces sp. XD-27 TaxID=3062779 RepID=UPI0026F446D7|nr:hypothetical protein [Streptomyces sp. XD-27]WKX69333.1 hypothetical protein Q3Y56_04795 [Streptomyces sp. XD-27]